MLPARLFLLINLLLCFQICFAQASEPTQLEVRIETDTLRKHLAVLASPDMQGRKAGTNGARKAARYILSEFRKMGLRAPDSIQQFFQFETDTVALKEVAKKRKTRIIQQKERVTAETANVIGYIPGKDYPNEFVVLSAHYDHLGIDKNQVFFGADDNAGGVSALLTIANAFSEAARAGNPPARTVVFVAFGAEEDGLIGSYFYTKYPVFSLENTSANINMDMIGRKKARSPKSKDAESMYVIGADRLSPDWKPILQETQAESDFLLDETYSIHYDPEQFFGAATNILLPLREYPRCFSQPAYTPTIICHRTRKKKSITRLLQNAPAFYTSSRVNWPIGPVLYNA